jgi:hypothetical protein
LTRGTIGVLGVFSSEFFAPTAAPAVAMPTATTAITMPTTMSTAVARSMTVSAACRAFGCRDCLDDRIVERLLDNIFVQGLDIDASHLLFAKPLVDLACAFPNAEKCIANGLSRLLLRASGWSPVAAARVRSAAVAVAATSTVARI